MLGVALEHHRAGRRAEAEKIYRQILSEQPDYADALHLLGVVLGEKGQPQLAIELIGRAIALRPQVPDYHANLGEFLRRAGQLEPSAASFRHAIALKADDAVFHNGLGVTLAKSWQTEAAIAAFRNAIRLKSDYADAHSNLGSALRSAGRYQEAINAYSTAIALKPDYATAHHNLSHLYLLLGDYRRGWAEFEWRLQVPSVVAPRRFDRPRWDGGDLAGKTIFVHAEQAFGDMIQFARFIPQLAPRGATVIFESLPELARLLEGFGRIVVLGQPIPAHDVHCSLLSLGGILGVSAQSIPVPIPYLKADPKLAEQWSRRFDSGDARLRVGLVWGGRALPDPNRAIRLKQLAPLASAGKAAFYSLQKGEPSAEAADPPPGMQLTDWANELKDFSDTAALVANLDLLITVDTAAAHLAGAMGKPVWLLLPFVPDWRWMLDREDSPWYPTMRLFRQQEPGKWEAALDRLRAALSERTRSASR
jgi:Flp pilus assembly protein TadD